MKLNKSGQLMLVSAASIGVASLLSACTQVTGTLTADFVYVTSARAAGSESYGEIDVFEVNAESGRMRQIPTSPFPSGGRNPVAEAVSTDNTNLFVVNHDDNTIVRFAIGNDGKVYPQQTVNTPGVFPMATAIAGSNLFVADTFQPLPTCSNVSPCSGSVAMYTLAADNSMSTPAVNTDLSTSYWPLVIPTSPTDIVTPTAIAASGSLVFVAAADTTTNAGYIFAYSSDNGVLTPLNGGTPVLAGTHPSALAVDPTGAYVYATDTAGRNIWSFAINGGALAQVSGSPFQAGNQPSAIMLDKTGAFAFVVNSQDSNVSVYAVSAGTLTRVSSYATGTQPVAVGIDPNLNKYVYTANFLGNTVSSYQINADGTLLNSQFSPSAANANPTAIASIPHKIKQ